MGVVKNLEGKRFGKLTVVSISENRRGKGLGKICWICKCDCGKTFETTGECLRASLTSSCGCIRKKIASDLGKSKIKTICKHGYARVAGSRKDCGCPFRIRQKKSANLKCNYGITLDDFNSIITKQGGRCLGCQLTFVTDSLGIFSEACLDHDHVTKEIRGVLCTQCNAALGCVRESPETLRRLMAYLSINTSKPLVYIIGRMKNHKIVQIANFFRQHGYDVFEDWNYAGPDADDWWQKRERERGRTYAETLGGRAAQNTYLFDKAYLDLARAVVLVYPAGKSAFMELGYSKGRGKATFVLMPKKTMKRYEVMTNFADAVLESKEEVLKSLDNYFSKGGLK